MCHNFLYVQQGVGNQFLYTAFSVGNQPTYLRISNNILCYSSDEYAINEWEVCGAKSTQSWSWSNTYQCCNARLLQRVRLTHLRCNLQNMTSLVCHCTICTHTQYAPVRYGWLYILVLLINTISKIILESFENKSFEK